MGSGYVIEHCVSALLERKKAEIYRVYVTDALRAAYKLDVRYADLWKPQETRTSEEIISTLKGKLAKLGSEKNEPIQPNGNAGA